MKLSGSKLRKLIREEITRVLRENKSPMKKFKEVTKEVYDAFSGGGTPSMSLIDRAIKIGEKAHSSISDYDGEARVKSALDDLKKIKRAMQGSGDPRKIFKNHFQHSQFGVEDYGSFDHRRGQTPEEPGPRPDLDDPDWFM